jgi:DNA-binding transcriptional LysR family regulator
MAVHLMLNHEAVAAVADNMVDLGVVLYPAEDTATVSRDLCASDLVCVMPEGHPLVVRDRVGPADLQAWPLISFGRHQPIGALIDGAFRDAGLRRNVAIEVNQSLHACLLAQSGAGIAVVDGFTTVGWTMSGVVVHPFAPAVRITARLLCARHRPLSQLAQAFIAELDDAVARHADRGALTLGGNGGV